jgi:hypothetical protein
LIAKITCPSCQSLGQFSVGDGNYKGPYHCWKCRASFRVEIVNTQMISCQPITENKPPELKDKQEAEKKNDSSDVVKAPSTSESPPSQQTPFVWPKIQDKVIPNFEPPVPPKPPFIWPTTRKNESDITTPSSRLNAASNTEFDLPADRPSKSNHGVLLFQNIAVLAEAEKLLINEGCIITRIAAPIDAPSGSTVALRFHWEQYETVKLVLGNAGVQTQGIRRLSK